MQEQTSKQKGTKQNENPSWKWRKKKKIYVFLLFEIKPIVSIVLQTFPKEQFDSIKTCLQNYS